ncbi:hypothetical protein MKW94_018849 [Papaver nudicaule]|uniref:Uncharacterized protein n=1 Tax=Papaver nudicaule TaxID=74823 RepID=A0AA42B2T5_PAPNU|nr:hypothetical protein [Papaver nudicaule]
MRTKLLGLKHIRGHIRQSVHWNSLGTIVFLVSCVTLLTVVVILTCPQVLEVFRFFFPLLFSTGICITVAYQFLLSSGNYHHQEDWDRGITNFEEEIRGDQARQQQRSYGNQFTFFMEDVVEASPVSLDGQLDKHVEEENYHHLRVKVVMKGNKKQEVERNTENDNSNDNIGGDCLEEEEQQIISSRVHNFAEGVWNCYFGRDYIWED